MVKFIIEVEEEFIHQFTDTERLKEETKKEKNIFGLLLDVLTFTHLEAKIKKGETEFVIKPNTSQEENHKRAYETAVSSAGTAFMVQNIESEKENKEINKEYNYYGTGNNDKLS